MDNRIIELRKDIEELESLQQQAVRHKVKDLLSLNVRKLISDVAKLEEEQRSKQAASANATAQGSANRTYQVKLNNYAWDQTPKFVKFYVTLQKVQSLAPENVYCNFTNKSLELNVKNLDNKDYILTINNLLKSINPEQSTWKVKSDMILISVAKVEQTSWSHVTELEKRASNSKKIVPDTDKSADPSEGLINIMRNMYEQGDDEMKRTIAKAWTESQTKGPNF